MKLLCFMCPNEHGSNQSMFDFLLGAGCTLVSDMAKHTVIVTNSEALTEKQILLSILEDLNSPLDAPQ